MFRLGVRQKFILTIFAVSCILLILLLIQLNHSATLIVTQSNVSPIHFPTPAAKDAICYVPHREENGSLPPLVVPIPDSAMIMHDVGTICYSKVSDSRMEFQVGSAGCFSSSCSVVYERNGTMKVDEENRQIVFTSYFAAEPYQPTGPDGLVCECTADCGGAGMMLFETGELSKGNYEIVLGEKVLGEIQIPFFSVSSPECLATD